MIKAYRIKRSNGCWHEVVGELVTHFEGGSTVVFTVDNDCISDVLDWEPAGGIHPMVMEGSGK